MKTVKQLRNRSTKMHLHDRGGAPVPTVHKLS